MSLYDRSKAEVEGLHRCMFEWCRGRVPDSTSAWDRIKLSWAPGFRLADAEGLVEGSQRLLALQVRFNESVEDPLKAVWIEGFTGYEVADDLFQVFYEEWRYWSSGQERGRAWSALLRSSGEGPQGLEWIHAHRSPLNEDARPSFRPLEASQDPEPALDEDTDGEPEDLPWAGAAEETLKDAPDDVLWGRREPPQLLDGDAPDPSADISPLTEIRAFFGDAEAQTEVGGSPPPVFDQHDPERWLRELRKGGAEAVLRAGIVVLGHLLGPWDEWFPEEKAPRGIHESLSRFQDGDPEGLTAAKALAEDALESSAAAREFEPEGPLPEGFRTYVHATNAADAASRLAGAAGGSAIALAVKLAPILAALPESTRLALRADVLQAFEEE